METKEQILEEMGPRDWSHKLILVVDDDQFMRYNINRFLTSRGYRVKLMKDGFDVLLVCLYLMPDLIISDIRMPKIDGVTLLEGLRNRLETRNIPVIFMSAFAADDVMEQARKLGAEYFLAKPFDNESLVGLIDNVLARHDAKKQAAGTEWNDHGSKGAAE